MALLHRVKRPIRRDTGALRDDRLFVIACDDTYAPKQYFDAFQVTRIQVHVVPTTDGSSAAKHVLQRLLNIEVEEDDERWLVLDTDHCIEGTHLEGFIGALQDARQRGVNVAVSRPCFEVWLAMHILDDLQDLVKQQTARAVSDLLKAALGKYDKTKLDSSDWTFAGVAKAARSAKELDAKVGGGDIPEGVTTRVYKIWEAIAAKGLPSQLPKELGELLSGQSR